MEKHEAAVEFTRRHDQIEAALRATASPLIGSFVAEMRIAWDKTRGAPLAEETAEKNPATGRKTQYLRTNAAAVARRLRAIHEAIAAAEALAISEPDQSQIPQRLGALAARLPTI